MSGRATAHTRTRGPAPRVPRRVSGPLRGAAAAAGAAGGVATPAPSRRRGTGAFERIKALPDHGVIDRLLRGRVWIWMIGLGLGGIVFMQVWMLKLNTGISRAVQSSATLERQNAELEASIARLSSGERIREAATRRGMVMPPAGSVRYVTVRPGSDGARAVTRMRAPSEEAKTLMANGGVATGGTAALTGVAPTTTQTTTTTQAATQQQQTTTTTAAPPQQQQQQTTAGALAQQPQQQQTTAATPPQQDTTAATANGAAVAPAGQGG